MAQHTIRLIAQRDDREGRQTWESLNEMGDDVLTVRARSLRALPRVAREVRLLRQLNEDGVRAAPRLIASRPWQYTIEAARSVQPARGRRVSEAARTESSTGEGALAASARADLDQLCEALNAKELALGLRSPAAIGMRSDSSVVVTDFSGLRPATFAAQQADARWISAAIGNTPARRVSHVQRQRSALIETTVPPRSRKPWVIAAGAVAAAVVIVGGGMILIGGNDRAAHADDSAQQAAEVASAGSEQEASTDGDGTAISHPMLLIATPDSPGSAAAEKDPTSEVRQADLAAGDDGAEVLTALADLRRDYLIGVGEQNLAAAQGTEAWSEDAALRQRLDGLTVSGGVTTVHEAQVLESDGATARLRAVISESPMTISGLEQGEQTTPATAKRTVLITLTRSDDGWRVSEVRRE